MTDALESFLNKQAESATKIMIKDPKKEIAFGLEKKYMGTSKSNKFAKSNLSKISTKKSTKQFSGHNASPLKSPMDMHDVKNLSGLQLEGIG